MGVELKPVTIDNWYACTQLQAKEEQQSVFPAPVVYWIAESKYSADFELRAVYADDREAERLVGFIVFCPKPDKDGNCWIPALLIDGRHQGKGYGRAAMERLIACMTEMNCARLMIGHRPNNAIAGRLYESLGFKKVNDDEIDGEIVRLLVTGGALPE
ncbi:GNAT family N-acetyltransferase [Paenibacillus sacheonensis]|uniref:GNAT family N-acetyltransferase n=1 Tax=Paenibacillus sacheonensis TaxID=742054 RepID=A0A7X5C4H7_9BACL|nr:GNAT family N-acetyltransferase [Paenibacillus sacheonensis]MBM7568572.1 diamine N-acetyltransferase [Paenibacillus sacheonensis]NBC72394.1 GNAT family N-acetyltransferase [Paenibacillus sacheonensis]